MSKTTLFFIISNTHYNNHEVLKMISDLKPLLNYPFKFKFVHNDLSDVSELCLQLDK